MKMEEMEMTEWMKVKMEEIEMREGMEKKNLEEN